MDTISPEVLGAIRWFYHHPDLLIKQFPDGIVPVDNTIIPLTRASADELKTYTADAMSHGSSLLRVSSAHVRIGAANQRLIGYPNVSPAVAHLVDGTQLWSAKDQGLRLLYGPAWENNSCAVDSVLVVLLHLEVGRSQGDQVSDALDALVASGPSAELSQAVMSIVRKPWGALQPSERTAFRDLCRRGLVRVDSARFAVGRFAGATSIFEELTWAIPQFHANWVFNMRCCKLGDWVWKISNGVITQRRLNGVVVDRTVLGSVADGLTFEEKIQVLLEPRADKTPRYATMPRCRHCRGKKLWPELRPVIYDRPPLSLAMRNYSSYGLCSGQFEPIALTFTVVGPDGLPTTLRARYACVAVIFCVHGNHFVTLVNTAARSGGLRFEFYDGMRGGGRLRHVQEGFQEHASKTGWTLDLMVYIRLDG